MFSAKKLSVVPDLKARAVTTSKGFRNNNSKGVRDVRTSQGGGGLNERYNAHQSGLSWL